jgi:hypothetical protein
MSASLRGQARIPVCFHSLAPAMGRTQTFSRNVRNGRNADIAVPA